MSGLTLDGPDFRERDDFWGLPLLVAADFFDRLLEARVCFVMFSNLKLYQFGISNM